MPKLLHLCEDEPREKSYQMASYAVDMMPTTSRTQNAHTAASEGDAYFVSSGMGWDDRRLNATCNIKALYCNDLQRQQIEAIHHDRRHFAEAFSTSPASQERARQLLVDNSLDDEALAMLESRWSRASRRTWRRKGDGLQLERVVYQWYLWVDALL